MDHLPKLKGITWKKERRLSQNADVLGVCLVAKHAATSSTGRHTGLRTGSVVRGLHDYSKEKIFLVTSEKIVREEELEDLKKRKNVLKASDYTLYFLSSSDPHSDSEPPKAYQLQDVTNLTKSEEKVIFNSGLVIIPIASEKLNKNSGVKNFRPFAASTEVTELKDLNDSICQIVEGSTKSIDVKSFKIEFIDNECALSLPEKETTHNYKNWTELTAGGAITNLHPYGAVILKSGCAVAVLNFVGDRISPVCLSEVRFSEATSRKNSLAEGTKESKKKDDISSGADLFLICGSVDTKLSKQTVCLDLNSDAESSKSSLAEGESKNGDAISPVISTNDGKSSRDGKPDQSESANGVEAQLEGSRAGCIKKIDPFKGTGAIPKRPKQDNSSKPETSSSKETLAEETNESKEKSDIFSKGETVPIQESAGLIEGSQDADEPVGGRGDDCKALTESSESSLAKGRSKKEDAISLVSSTMCGETPGQGGSKIAIPNPKNGACASPDKKGKQPRRKNQVSAKENPKEDLKSKPVENGEENEMKVKVAFEGLSAAKKNQEPRDPTPGSSARSEGQETSSICTFTNCQDFTVNNFDTVSNKFSNCRSIEVNNYVPGRNNFTECDNDTINNSSIAESGKFMKSDERYSKTT